jgi:hypothetical protein
MESVANNRSAGRAISSASEAMCGTLAEKLAAAS